MSAARRVLYFIVMTILWGFLFFSSFAEESNHFIYGKDIDNWSEEIKMEQRENGKQLFADISEAIGKGKNEIILEKKHYRFNLDHLDRRSFLVFNNLENFTINGNGAKLWFEDYRTAISITNCYNLTIHDVTIDYDPLPFSQMVITDIGDNYIEGITEDGFLGMDQVIARLGRDHMPRIKIFVFDPNTGLLKPDVAHNHIDSIVSAGDNRLRFYGRPFGNTPFSEMNIDPGDRAGIIMRYAHGVVIRDSGEIKFERFNMYASPMFGITMSTGEGPFKFRDSKLIPRPNTKRLMGINGDAMHLTSVKNGPIIENSEFSAAGDDLINLHGDFGLVQQQLAPNEVIIAVKSYRNIYEGSKLSFYDAESLQYKTTRKVLEIRDADTPYREDARTIGEHIIHWPGNHSLICILDAEVDLMRYDWVESDYDGGYGAIIRNNKFYNATTRAIIVKTKDAVIENNTLSHIDNVAIGVFGSPIWGEGPFPENVTIKGNVIDNSNIGFGARFRGTSLLGAISVGNYYRGELRYNVRPIRNIIIENNHITNSGTAGIFLIHSKNGDIINNTLDGFWVADPRYAGYNFGIEPFAGIYVDDSENVRIKNNTFLHKGQYARDLIKIGRYADESSITIE